MLLNRLASSALHPARGVQTRSAKELAPEQVKRSQHWCCFCVYFTEYATRYLHACHLLSQLQTSMLAVPGLLNNGENLCYLNSAVQALASSRSVLAAVQGSLKRYCGLANCASGPSKQTAGPQLLEALTDVLQQLQPRAGDERAAISAGAVALALRYALSPMQQSSQPPSGTYSVGAASSTARR